MTERSIADRKVAVGGKTGVFAAIHENGEIILLEQTEIIRIYAENDRVYARQKTAATG